MLGGPFLVCFSTVFHILPRGSLRRRLCWSRTTRTRRNRIKNPRTEAQGSGSLTEGPGRWRSFVVLTRLQRSHSNAHRHSRRLAARQYYALPWRRRCVSCLPVFFAGSAVFRAAEGCGLRLFLAFHSERLLLPSLQLFFSLLQAASARVAAVFGALLNYGKLLSTT